MFMPKITHEEFENALLIVERYTHQEDKTIQVSVEYTAKVSATVRVPNDWSVAKIKKELKDGYYGFPMDDDARTKLTKMVELVVDGEIVKL